jgi:hypothetical protein
MHSFQVDGNSKNSHNRISVFAFIPRENTHTNTMLHALNYTRQKSYLYLFLTNF